MPREQQGFRTTLADILEFTDGARLMTAKRVGEYLGIDQRTAKSRFGITGMGIAVPELARKLCRLTERKSYEIE